MLRITILFVALFAVTAFRCIAANSREGEMNSNVDFVPSVFFGEREAEVRPQPDAPSESALKPPEFGPVLLAPPEEYPAQELPMPSEPPEFNPEPDDTLDPCDCDSRTFE